MATKPTKTEINGFKLLTNQYGLSLVEVLVAGGIMTIIASSIAMMMVQQGSQVKQLSQKIVLNDTKNSMILAMLNSQACVGNLDAAIDSNLSFNSASAGNKSMTLSKIRVGSDPASPILLEQDKEIGSGSGLFVDSIILDELTNVGGGKWSGIWKVNIRNAFMGLQFKPITLNLQLFDVDATVPASAKIIACHGVLGGGGGSIWSTNGTSIYYNGGNVGIGTTTPTEKLDVAGSITLSPPGANNEIRGVNDIFFDGGVNGISWLVLPQKGVGDILEVHDSTTDKTIAVFQDTGNVGIGTLTPTARLGVSKTPTSTSDYLLRLDNNGSDLYGTGLKLDMTGAGGLSVALKAGTAATAVLSSGAFYIATNSDMDLNNPSNKRFHVLGNGDVGIGVAAPTSKLQVAGDITPDTSATKNLGSGALRWSNIYLTNAPNVSSDARLKKDVKTSDLGLDFINSLRPVSWVWKDPNQGTARHYGVIAQEAESAIAKAKGEDSGDVIVTRNKETDSYSVRYTELISPLIKAIQELYNELLGVKTVNTDQARQIASKAEKAEVDQLREQVQKLEADNSALKDRLKKIEAMLESK